MLSRQESGLVGVFRGAFDPVTEGHFSAIKSSVEQLCLSKIFVIFKLIGEKDFNASLQHRMEMMRLHLEGNNLPVEIIRQDVRGHVIELVNLRSKYNVINICDTEKAPREMEVYGKTGDTFGITLRNSEHLSSAYKVAEEKGIGIIEIDQPYYTSSTFVRRNILDGYVNQDGLHPNVSDFILTNNLYLPRDTAERREKFISRWYVFLDVLMQDFPNLQLLDIPEPEFKATQHEEEWLYKYIRTVIKFRGLIGEDIHNLIIQIDKIYGKPWLKEQEDKLVLHCG